MWNVVAFVRKRLTKWVRPDQLFDLMLVEVFYAVGVPPVSDSVVVVAEVVADVAIVVKGKL